MPPLPSLPSFPSLPKDTFEIYKTLSALPQGKRIFSTLFSQKAPYFASVHLQVQQMGRNRAEVVIPKRRSVQNHIGTVHAIAVANGLEAAMGLLAEATTPKGYRWLPKGMTIDYLALSDSDITCVAETTDDDWSNAPDVPVKVTATREDGTVVVQGIIRIWVTPKKKSAAKKSAAKKAAAKKS
jgi:acyl-coenzyme A thioesterase PaaI-like protein